MDIWDLLVQMAKTCKDQEKWIAEREKALQDLENQTGKPKINDIPKISQQLEKEKQELDSRVPALKILDSSYSKLAQESRLSPDNIKQLTGPVKTIIIRWHELNDKHTNLVDRISKINKLRERFLKNHTNSIVLLTNISAKLMQAELVQNPKKRLRRVNELEKELEKESGCLRAADETGLELMKRFPEPQNVSATQIMVDEYQNMWKDLRNRFADIK